MQRLDGLDLSEEPDQLEPGTPGALDPEVPAAQAPAPSGTRRGPRRGFRVGLAVLVVLLVAAAGTAYVLSRPPPSTTPVVPPVVVPCLGDTAGNWPTYLGEVTRDSQNCGEHNLSSANAAQLTQLWSFNTSFASPGYLQAEPVVANNTVYIGGGNGDFYALNATTGARVWVSPNLGTDLTCVAFPNGITSSATVSGGVVYVGGGNDYFYALNESTGQVDWQFDVGNTTLGYYNWASPLVLSKLGYVYIGVASNCDRPLVNGGLDQVSLSTHQLVRFFSDLSPAEAAQCNNSRPPPHNVTSPGCGGSIWGSPTFDAATSTIWAATGNGYNLSVPEYGDSLMEWNASTLALVTHWTIPNAQQIDDGDFGATPTLVDPPGGPPMVFVTDKNGWSYAFDRNNLAQGPLWQTNISETPSVTPDASGGGLVYIAGHGTEIGTQHFRGGIRAFAPTVNRTVWALGLPGEVFGAPAYANGLVVVTGGSLLDVLNASTGRVLFSYVASQPFFAAPAIANGRIYVGNSNGLLLAFGLPPGVAATTSHVPAGGAPAPGGSAAIGWAPRSPPMVAAVAEAARAGPYRWR